MSTRFWLTSILIILVLATLTFGFSPAAHAQKAAYGDNSASAYTVSPQTGYYCPMGNGYPNMTNSPKSGYKTSYFKRGGYRGSWDSGRQGNIGPHQMGCYWY